MHTHNSINYVEFGATDLSAIEGFYAKVFGWKFTSYGPSYVAFTDGKMDGGFDTTAPIAKGALVIMYSSELESTRDAVLQAGGTILQEIFTFPGGRRFHFEDPSGNELAVWSE